MPVYKYKCMECGFMDEYIRVIKDADLTPECRMCQSVTQRIMIFKGTVWSSGGHK
jgi:putative FmdB family regulatory protein